MLPQLPVTTFQVSGPSKQDQFIITTEMFEYICKTIINFYQPAYLNTVLTSQAN